MDQSLFKFDLIAEDPTTHARAGVLHTPHGDIETPIFMPVGTKANVKGIPTETVKQLGAQIVLANTYHLSMRPGEDTIAELGGLHKFMNWHGPILTDSGGFQVFSHNDAVKLTDEGVRFIVNDYDGRHVFWTPEDNMEIAMKLGSDICMQLDQCPGYPATRAYVERAVELSSMWAERCYKAHTRDDQALFGIVQGGMHLDLRLRSLRHLEECGDFPGYGIGGYSVGEDHETMFETLAPLVSEYMPKHKPRYLMGVGNPTTLVRGVGVGIDMFDCVLPTLCARRRPHRSHLHLPGVHGRLQPRAHPPHGHAEGDARRHFAVDAQHLLPAQPYAACSPGHYRGPLRCVRERLDEQPCGGGLLRATDTLAERGQRQWSSASRSSHSLTPAARPLTDSLQVLDASWVPYRIVDARAGV